ncbi:hypothetical protein GCM10027418_02440 [Mariniluteicoccus endophyticus]
MNRIRSKDGAARATPASLSIGVPAIGGLPFVCDLLGQGTAPWFWVGLAGGLLVGVGGIEWRQGRWVRHLVRAADVL